MNNRTWAASRAGIWTRSWAVLGILAVLKLLLLAIIGPIMTPDSGGYSGTAQAILSTTSWLHDAGLSQSYAPAFAFRIIGYPLFLAAVMAATGPAWAYATVVLQSMLSLYAAWMALRVGEELGLSRGLSVLAVFFYATSLQLLLDQCILTDSMNASCVIIATVLLVRGTRQRLPLSIADALAAGILLALAFLLREIMQATIFLFLLLLVLRVVLALPGSRLGTMAAAALVLAVPLATMEGYRQWNVHRTGERFVTTGGQTAMLQPLAWVAERHHGLISADTPLDRTLRSEFKDYTFANVLAANAALFKQGYTALDISRMATARYITAWREHPVWMLSLLSAIRESQARIAVRTMASVCEAFEWAEKEWRCYDYRDLYRAVLRSPSSMSWQQIFTFLAMSLQNTMSLVVFMAFVIGAPVAALAAGRWIFPTLTAETRLLLAAFWALYAGWCMAYVLIHFESRYMAPVAPLAVMAGLFILQEIRRVRWRRLRSG